MFRTSVSFNNYDLTLATSRDTYDVLPVELTFIFGSSAFGAQNNTAKMFSDLEAALEDDTKFPKTWVMKKTPLISKFVGEGREVYPTEEGEIPNLFMVAQLYYMKAKELFGRDIMTLKFKIESVVVRYGDQEYVFYQV